MIKIKNLYNQPGELIQIPKELETREVSKGTYVFVGEYDNSIMLYNGSISYLYGFNEEFELQNIPTTQPEKINSLIEAYTYLTLNLIESGEDSSRIFDKLEELIHLRNLLEE